MRTVLAQLIVSLALVAALGSAFRGIIDRAERLDRAATVERAARLELSMRQALNLGTPR